MANYFTEHRNISHFLPNMLIIVDKCWVDKPRRSQGLGKHKHTSSCSHSPVNSSNVYNSMHTINSKHWSQREARGHWGCWRSCSQHDTGYRGRVLSPRPGLMGVSMMRLDTSHPAHCLTINWHKLIGEIRSRSSWQYFSSLNLNIREWSHFNQPEKNRKENLFFLLRAEVEWCRADNQGSSFLSLFSVGRETIKSQVTEKTISEHNYKTPAHVTRSTVSEWARNKRNWQKIPFCLFCNIVNTCHIHIHKSTRRLFSWNQLSVAN